MRFGSFGLLFLSGVPAPAGPVCAAPIVMPDSNPEPYSAYASKAIEQPWLPQRADTQLREQPLGEVLAARFGLAEGSAELFRYNVENGPSTRAQLDGVIDGGGIRLKLSW